MEGGGRAELGGGFFGPPVWLAYIPSGEAVRGKRSFI